MKSTKIIVVLGRTTSGKTTLAKEIAKVLKAPYLSAGETIRKEYAQYTLTSQKPILLQDYAAMLVKQKGERGFVDWIWSQNEVSYQTKRVVLEGIRQPTVYHTLKEIDTIYTVWCTCGIDTQITRLIARDNKTQEEAQIYRNHPNEQEVATLSPFAEFTYNSEEDQDKQLKELIQQLQEVFL